MSLAKRSALGLAVLTIFAAPDIAAQMIPSQTIAPIIGSRMSDQFRMSLDEITREQQTAAIRRAVQAPQSGAQTWRNEQQQAMGTVTPLRSFSRDGKQCAEVAQTMSIRGESSTETSAFCAEQDGSLTLVN
jgi:surface antigen